MTVLSLPHRPKIKSQRFQLVQPKAHNPARNSNNQNVLMGEPTWVCEVETTELQAALSGEYKWAMASSDGEGLTFYIYDAERQRPLYGPLNTGAVTVTAVSRANRTLTLGGLTPGAAIAKGDYLHWDDGPARRLHILGAATANGSGVAVVRCEPPPPATLLGSLPAAVTFNRAAGEFQIFDFSSKFDASSMSSRASFTASSIIRRF